MKQLLILLLITTLACKNYYNYPAFSDNGNPMMVVEIPAGTNDKYEYNPQTNKFELDQIDGKPRVINYLPYPANYGFIPSTLMDKSRGGDGDPLDVVVIGSTIRRGSLLEFIPVGVMMLLDDGEEDHKIIGVAVNSEISIVDCRTLKCINEKYPGIQSIIETWFKNYKSNAVIEITGWQDEKQALDMVRKWQKSGTD